MVLAVEQLLDVFQLFNTVGKELSLNYRSKLKRIHNQQVMLCDIFQCEISRMQIYEELRNPQNKCNFFYATLQYMGCS
jgi:hypothetical protein